VAQIGANGSLLTGGTKPSVTVAITAKGEPAFVNNPVLNATRQRDFMRNQYDSASGNHI
jgi:hypothetical protein